MNLKRGRRFYQKSKGFEMIRNLSRSTLLLALKEEGTNIRASCYRTVLCKPVYLEKQISPTVDVPEVTTEKMRFSF